MSHEDIVCMVMADRFGAGERLEDLAADYGLSIADALPFLAHGVRLWTEEDKQGARTKRRLVEETALREKLADILTRTANALKGPPAENALHGWHDLPEVAERLQAKLLHYKKAFERG